MKLPSHPAVPVDAELQTELLATAHRAADAAAAITLASFRTALAVDNKSDSGAGAEAGAFDPVTEADRQAERAIRDVVLGQFPSHAFLGEESGPLDVRDALTWVVDPIDGTRAFITGSPLWGTLISVYDGEAVVFGLLDQPFLEERLVGLRDGTTLRNRQGTETLCTRASVRLADARLQATAPELFATPQLLAAFERVQAQVELTRFGGDCYSYALLAMGHVDIVVECGLEPYDIQALIPIVQGAGGCLTSWDGGSAAGGGRVVATANPALHAEVLTCLAASA